MNQNAVIFDWNGTLLDDVHEVHETFVHIQKHFGIPASSLEDYREKYDMPLDNLYLRLGFTLDTYRNNIDSIHELFHTTYAPREDKTELRPGAAAALKHLSDNAWHCVMLSNHLVDSIATQCRRLAVGEYFKDYLAYKERQEQKKYQPKSDRLGDYMQKKGLKAQHSIIVGDTPEEIRIAHEHGLVGVAITGGYAAEDRLRAEKPDFLIHHLCELPAIADKVFKKGGRR